MREKLIIGNWKMNIPNVDVTEYGNKLQSISTIAKKNNVNVGIAVPSVFLDKIGKAFADYFIVAAQNIHFENKGAFTGEISPEMLESLNIKYSIVGHSERRTYFGETNETCNKKISALIAKQIRPIYCVGETLQQYENNLSKEVVKAQLTEGLKCIKNISGIVVAYEPVWSIGTGRSASAQIAQEMCQFIRSTITELYGNEQSEKVVIQYGGSVKKENVKQYIECPDIDGVLVGGASLDIEEFVSLIKEVI